MNKKYLDDEINKFLDRIENNLSGYVILLDPIKPKDEYVIAYNTEDSLKLLERLEAIVDDLKDKLCYTYPIDDNLH